MKKLLLTGIAALFLATGTAHAGTEQSKIVLLCNGISRFPPERGLKPERFTNFQIVIDLSIQKVLFDHYELFISYNLPIQLIDSNEIHFASGEGTWASIQQSDYATGSINRVTGRGGILFGNNNGKPFTEGWELACRAAKPLF